MMVVLMAFCAFNNTVWFQDNNKTIDVLGASYTQELIVSAQLNNIKRDMFKHKTETSQLLSFRILEKPANQEKSTEEVAPATTAVPTTSTKTASKAKTKDTKITSTTTKATTSESGGYYVKTYKITHFCGCSKCNPGNAGMTASGKKLKVGMIAMRGVPFGTIVEINGKKYVVEDRCASNSIIDVYVESHSKALQKGTYKAKVKIYK